MPKFELKVCPEPKDGAYCGECQFLTESNLPYVPVFWCDVFIVGLDHDEAEGALRCGACIEAEKGASDGPR